MIGLRATEDDEPHSERWKMTNTDSIYRPFQRGLDADFMSALKGLTREDGWFADVLADTELILGIRDNYLNVYWQGQSLYKICWTGGDVVVFTHPKYLVRSDLADPIRFTGSTFQTDNIVPLITQYDRATLPSMKRAAGLYCGPEKKGLHSIIQANPNVVDTEIAFSTSSEDGGPSIPRIDLAAFVRSDGLKLRFWEAKHFKNPELRSQGEVPVIGQIKRYRELIANHREELELSYRTIASNLVDLASWGKPGRTVAEEIKAVAAGTPFSIEDPAYVGLLIYGFDRAQKLDESWRKHLTVLKNTIGNSVECAGQPKSIRIGAASKTDFLAVEKQRHAAFKAQSSYFSETARRDGVYLGEERPFCVPVDCAAENLYSGVREAALRYFQSSGIQWHHGHDRMPSNHLCDSQVSCVNFLFH